MTILTLTTARELDSRVNDGIHVRLLWAERDARIWVAVADSKQGEEFSVEVRDHEQALDVFHHPFAYAAHHAVATTGSSVDSITPVAQAA